MVDYNILHGSYERQLIKKRQSQFIRSRIEQAAALGLTAVRELTGCTPSTTCTHDQLENIRSFHHS